MSAVTAEKIGDDVGALVTASTATACSRTRRCPTGPSTLEEQGRWSSATSTSTMPPRSSSASSLGTVELFGHGEPPRSSASRSTPPRTAAADYLRGTFDWHIDGCTDDIPIMATVLSAHAVADSGGETEFASTYGAYEALAEEDKERFLSVRVVHTIEASQRSAVPTPRPSSSLPGAADLPRSIHSCGSTTSVVDRS